MKYHYLLPLLFTSMAIATSHPPSVPYSDKESWGVGMGMRSANIIFDTSDNVVHDVMPLLFYQATTSTLMELPADISFTKAIMSLSEHLARSDFLISLNVTKMMYKAPNLILAVISLGTTPRNLISARRY